MVEAVGEDVTGVAPGDHVVFCFVPSCGQCGACRSGRRTLCEPAAKHSFAGTLLDGTLPLRGADGAVLQHGLTVACFAEYAVVAAAGAIPIPKELPLWQAALLGCGVVTGFGAVTHAARVRIGEQVCVIGCGGVGLQVIAAARLAGAATIVAVDRRPEKLEHALRRGATHAVDAQERRRRPRGPRTHRRRCRPRLRGRRRRGDDQNRLGLAASRWHGDRRRGGGRRDRGLPAGDSVHVREVDRRQLYGSADPAETFPA